MRSFIRLTDFKREELFEIFKIADSLEEYSGFLSGKTVVMFFPSSSIRTRVSFEKGIYLLGGQSVLFDPSTLEKKEELYDVCMYLQNWADVLVVRHKDINLLESMAKIMNIPVMNALTDENHPCEMMSDLYSLSKIRNDYLKDEYLFVGADGNIGKAWKEAAEAFGLHMMQCCPEKYRIKGVTYEKDIKNAIKGKDIVCTDSIPENMIEEFRDYRITKKIMERANKKALLNPCPPFYRGEEVSEDVIDSEYFAGYEFKKSLLDIQQAIMIFCMTH